jgi:hypothetical protein
MPLPDDFLKSRIAECAWTGYSIRLSEEVVTTTARPDFFATDPRLQGILRLLGIVYRGNLHGLRIADLGCLEGGHALAMALRGAQTLGVDAREESLKKALLLRDHFDLANLAFTKADVKDFTREAYGDFDVVLCLGLLYHLDDPVTWLCQIAKATRGLLIIDTHFAPVDDNGLKSLDPSIRPGLSALEQRKLGEIRCEGRWFQEIPAGVDLHSQPWAAYSNDRSFWLTKQSLFTALGLAGFDMVAEQHDWVLTEYAAYQVNLARIMVVAAKTGGFDEGPHPAWPGQGLAAPDTSQASVTAVSPRYPRLRSLDARIRSTLETPSRRRLKTGYERVRQPLVTLLKRL